jgi:hypothetical protein
MKLLDKDNKNIKPKRLSFVAVQYRRSQQPKSSLANQVFPF